MLAAVLPEEVDLTGIDWSPGMLHAARRQADQVHRAVTLHRADATALPFPAETLDTVVSTFALCCIPAAVLPPAHSLIIFESVANGAGTSRRVGQDALRAQMGGRSNRLRG